MRFLVTLDQFQILNTARELPLRDPYQLIVQETQVQGFQPLRIAHCGHAPPVRDREAARPHDMLGDFFAFLHLDARNTRQTECNAEHPRLIGQKEIGNAATENRRMSQGAIRCGARRQDRQLTRDHPAETAMNLS